MKITDNICRLISEMSRSSRKLLTFALPAITLFLGYILWYLLSDPLNYSAALQMTERAMGALFVALAAAFVLDTAGRRG